MPWRAEAPECRCRHFPPSIPGASSGLAVRGPPARRGSPKPSELWCDRPVASMPIQDDARYVRIAPLAGTDCWSVVGRAARRLATRENVPGSSPRRGIGNLGSVEFIVLAPSSWSDERQTADRKNRTRLAGLASPIESTTSPNTKRRHSVIHVTAHSPAAFDIKKRSEKMVDPHEVRRLVTSGRWHFHDGGGRLWVYGRPSG